MDAVVEGPVEAVEQSLNIEASTAVTGIILSLGKACKDELLFVGDAVIVCVFEIPNVGSGADEEAAIVVEEGGGPRQVFCKNGALIEVAVAIGIHQEANAPQPFVAALRVVAHLHDKQAAIFVEAHGDWIDDQRFGRDQIEMETGFDLKCTEGLRWFHRRNSGQVFWVDLGFGRAEPGTEKKN